MSITRRVARNDALGRLAPWITLATLFVDAGARDEFRDAAGPSDQADGFCAAHAEIAEMASYLLSLRA